MKKDDQEEHDTICKITFLILR